MQYQPILKDCTFCFGNGSNREMTTRYQWNYSTKRNQLKYVYQTRKCFKCRGKGKIVDQKAQQQRKRIAQQKEKQFQEFQQKQKQFQAYRQKQKQFLQYSKEQQLTKPLLQEDDQDSDNESNQWQKIKKQSILSVDKSQGVAYCGKCAGKCYQKQYLSNQTSVCSNCNGSGRIILSQASVPQLVLKKKQEKNGENNKQQEQEPIKEEIQKKIFCGQCGGKGEQKDYIKNVIRKCQSCNGTGVLDLDPDDYRVVKHGLFQHYKQYTKIKNQPVEKKKNKNKKPISNQNIYEQPRMKTQAQLRAEFEIKYNEQQKQKQRRERERKEKQAEAERIRKKQIEERLQKQRQENHRKYQQYIKTPQGRQFERKRKIEMKWEERKQACCDCLGWVVRILCCGGPSCGRVLIWCGAIFIILMWTVLFIVIKSV